MSALIRRPGWFLLALIVLSAAWLGNSVSRASARPGEQTAVPCQSRAGTVWLANRQARVYSRRGRVYACHPGGGSVFLFAAKKAAFAQVKLAGRFVAWREQSPVGGEAVRERIAVLALVTGKTRRVGSTLVGGHEVVGSGLTKFAVTSSGTVVWLLQTATAEGNTTVGPCSFSSTLYDNTGHRTSVLDQFTNGLNGFPGNGSMMDRCASPITSFGLSTDGHVVYWATNDQLKSHRIP